MVRRTRWLGCLLVVAGVGLTACGDSGGTPAERDAGGGSDSGVVLRCSAADDPDGDFISSMDEGTADPDGDGRPNSDDDDSDGDGLLDRDEAGDANCSTPPVDSDGDGTPDYLDTDGNGDGVPDRDQRGSDLDGDGRPDAVDLDVDGDGIENRDEFGDGTTPVDTDTDGTPDVRDTDSDGDSILDAHEGRLDPDGDGQPNFRDLDSDEDGTPDSVEAGDGDPMTPPTACANEIDPVTGMVGGDGYPDYADFDSDNDGFGDQQERAVGTDPCDIDSDDDGQDDLAEGSYVLVNCPDGTSGTDCDCATSAGCAIPETHFYVVLPYGEAPQTRLLDFGTTIRVADIFFVTDTTGSMGGVLERVKQTVATPGTGLIARIVETIPDAWFGGGQHDDMPFGGYGSSPDEPLILAIGMTPPSMAAAVQTAFNAIALHGGNDGPESQTEALYQIMTGVGGMWTYSGGGGWGGGSGTYELERYVGRCLDTGWGAPCFREAALPVVVHFSDICSHNGPPGEDSSCDDYVGISPEPATWNDAMREMVTRGARYVGINSSGSSCAGLVGPSGFSPCYFMKRTAEETGSIDLDGNPLVYDLPSSGGSDLVFADTVVGAIETIATRVPLDVDTALRDGPGDDGVDATRFIKRRQPACIGAASGETCWVAPAGVTHEDAVAAYDQSTFFGVVPGTRVTFRITFQNDFRIGGQSATVYVAFIDVRGGGSSVLDTRQVYIVVPATSTGPG